MAKRIIYLIAITALFILVITGGAYWWLSSADLTSMTHKIEKLVEEKTGREVVIKGGIAVYPGIRSTIVLKEVDFSNAKWAKGSSLFSAKKIALTLSSWGLLKGDVRLSKVNITGLDAHLQTRANGDGNWDALFNQPKTKDDDHKALYFKRLLMTDSHITYNSDNQLTIKNAAFKINHSDKVVFIRLAGEFNKEPLQMEGKIKQLDDMDEKRVPTNFAIKLGNMKLTMKGSLSTNTTKKSPWLKGSISLSAMQLSDINHLFNMHLPSAKPAYLKSHITASQDNYILDELTAHIGEAIFKGKVEFTKQRELEHWRLDLKGNAADAGLFLKQLGITEKMQGGTFYIDADVSTHGNTLAAKKSALSGTTNLGIYNAKFHHENDPNIAKSFVSVLAGTKMPSQIKMNCLIASFAIEEGIATAKALVFDTKGATVAGKGSVDLTKNNVNLTLKLNKKGLSLTPLKTPYRVKGPLDDPSILPGVSGEMVVGAVFSAVTGVGVVGFLAANVIQNLGGSLLNHSVCGQLLEKT